MKTHPPFVVAFHLPLRLFPNTSSHHVKLSPSTETRHQAISDTSLTLVASQTHPLEARSTPASQTPPQPARHQIRLFPHKTTPTHGPRHGLTKVKTARHQDTTTKQGGGAHQKLGRERPGKLRDHINPPRLSAKHRNARVRNTDLEVGAKRE
ncbi:hypothetical protein LY76DRAFT_142353 [Colletotrichum caudatum]|nr:hypothetical protein LY76DRAFT_142353 [Colletotrichum caudatum]